MSTADQIQREIRDLKQQRAKLSDNITGITNRTVDSYFQYREAQRDRFGGPYFIGSVRYDNREAYLARLKNNYDDLNRERRAALTERDTLDAQISAAEANLAQQGSDAQSKRAVVNLRDGGTEVVTSQQNIQALFARGEITQQERDRAAVELTEAQRGQPLSRAAADQGSGAASSGDLVQQAQDARTQGALDQNPPLPPEKFQQGVGVVPQATPDVTTNAVPSVTAEPMALDAPPVLPSVAEPDSAAPPSQVTSSPGVNLLSTELPQSSTQNFVYKLVTCVSKFSKGRFTQDLEGVLLVFPDDTTKANTNTPAQQADVRRVDNAIDASNPTTQNVDQRESSAPANSTGRTGTGALANAKSVVLGGGNSSVPVPGNQRRDPSLNVDVSQDPPTSGRVSAGNPQTLAAAAPPTPATSGNRVVGMGGTTPANSGNVSVNVVLLNGTVRQVTTQAEIQQLFAQGLISALERTTASQGLSIRQRAAQNASTNTAPQRIAKDDNGG